MWHPDPDQFKIEYFSSQHKGVQSENPCGFSVSFPWHHGTTGLPFVLPSWFTVNLFSAFSGHSFLVGQKADFVCSLLSEQFQAWTGFYASRNVLKGVARRASSLSYAAESLFVRYQIKYPDGPVHKEWAMDKLKAIRWAVSEVINV